MYKVFIENSPLKFENNTSKNVNLVANFMPILKKDKYHEFAAQLSGLKEEVILNMADFNSFFNDFSYIEAAGGIVYHKKINKYLFIHRFGKWDLPKGKIDGAETSKEAAVREIREECGITGLKLIKQLIDTYHTYDKYDDIWLKKTHWFYFEYEKYELLQPQHSEGITTARWFSKNELFKIKNNTYKNILELLETSGF